MTAYADLRRARVRATLGEVRKRLHDEKAIERELIGLFDRAHHAGEMRGFDKAVSDIECENGIEIDPDSLLIA